MTPRQLAKYGQHTAVIREVITRTQGRIEVLHPKGKDTFEYDDSSERRDQLANAIRFVRSLYDINLSIKQLDETGKVGRIFDEVTDPGNPRYVIIDEFCRMVEPGTRRE